MRARLPCSGRPQHQPLAVRGVTTPVRSSLDRAAVADCPGRGESCSGRGRSSDRSTRPRQSRTRRDPQLRHRADAQRELRPVEWAIAVGYQRRGLHGSGQRRRDCLLRSSGPRPARSRWSLVQQLGNQATPACSSTTTGGDVSTTAATTRWKPRFSAPGLRLAGEVSRWR